MASAEERAGDEALLAHLLEPTEQRSVEQEEDAALSDT